MDDNALDAQTHALRFNPSEHLDPWVALNEALDARGPAYVVVIDGAVRGARGRITSSSANSEARLAVIDQLNDASLLSLLVLRGPTVHGDEALALALASDLRWATSGAALECASLLEGDLPYTSASHATVGRLGRSRALALALRDGPLTAAQALTWGLVDEVIADHDLDARIEAFVATTARVPRDLMAETKALLQVADEQIARRRETDARERLSDPS
jgi:enoyl-CoA hydratase/carnithine racemase